MTDLFGPGAFGASRAASSRPSVTPGNGAIDPATWFKDCTSPTLADGTEVRAGFLNALLAQLRGVINAGGLPLDNTDDNLLARVSRAQLSNYVAATGTGNAMAVTLSPAPVASPAEIKPGFPLRILAPGANTTAVTLSVNGGAAAAVKYPGGADLGASAIATGQILNLVFNGTYWEMVNLPANWSAGGGGSYVAKAGDTMTGALNLPANGLQMAGSQLVTASGRFGVGISPVAPFHAYAIAGGAAVAATGTTDASTVARIQGGGVGIDFGVLSSGATYIQSRLTSDYSSTFPHLINPVGGAVGIGTGAAALLGHVHIKNAANSNPVLILDNAGQINNTDLILARTGVAMGALSADYISGLAIKATPGAGAAAISRVTIDTGGAVNALVSLYEQSNRVMTVATDMRAGSLSYLLNGSKNAGGLAVDVAALFAGGRVVAASDLANSKGCTVGAMVSTGGGFYVDVTFTAATSDTSYVALGMGVRLSATPAYSGVCSVTLSAKTTAGCRVTWTGGTAHDVSVGGWFQILR